MDSAARAEEFWAKVDKSGGPGRCWIWTGTLREAYGHFSIYGEQQPAHRAAYELEVGPIPEGLVLDHLCGNKLCVRPDHLEAVSLVENSRRGNHGCKLHKGAAEKVLTLRMEERLYTALAKAARDVSVNVNEWIREAIRRRLRSGDPEGR